ncbi:TetR/AcrR family transcriptional regulator [Bacillus cytotoxicus]|uniref:TetR/AcrR family transcriptional regulator n=1 Tax=Bacillus cytotoxicus TaxID=580165 RepID=A0ACC6AD05_9BACI|nr:TetR/AcrR family transcriptional regulator [Bacillus cytotoxicus]HDX9579088.1 TetR/AcrR family transcriptional regulator [Bacillus pseudomycoides]
MSMTANRIKSVALSHFARYGYEGTSLANIAGEVGIKKPSIYAHFKGKEELYFICLEESLQKDLAFFKQYVKKSEETPFGDFLFHLLKNYGHRFQESIEAMFWLRTSFFPPFAFREQIMEKANAYIESIGQLLVPIFEQAQEQKELCNIEVTEAVAAYLCLMDGLMVEFLFAGIQPFENRLYASWKVFWRGLSS